MIGLAATGKIGSGDVGAVALLTGLAARCPPCSDGGHRHDRALMTGDALAAPRRPTRQLLSGTRRRFSAARCFGPARAGLAPCGPPLAKPRHAACSRSGACSRSSNGCGGSLE
jgi:hypothetical protein